VIAGSDGARTRSVAAVPTDTRLTLRGWLALSDARFNILVHMLLRRTSHFAGQAVMSPSPGCGRCLCSSPRDATSVPRLLIADKPVILCTAYLCYV
jgi:hypothetical protein